MIEEEDIVSMYISEGMLEYAKSLEEKMQMNRTKESEVDTLTGLLGELVFADWWYNGDWKRGNSYENLVNNFGKPDFEGRFEVKSSTHKFSWNLNLLIREDYNKRIPPFYVQVLFDTDKKELTTMTPCSIIGYADGNNAHNGELKEMAGITSYKCYHTPFTKLNPIYDLRFIINGS